MEADNDKGIFRKYSLDYVGKYYFYEEEDFSDEVENGDYILENIKKSNRFDYNNATYTYTKYGNISKGITERSVILEVEKDNIDVKMNNENIHLDLRYKMDVKRLEDHYRITTRISEKAGHTSVLLYPNLEDGEDCIKALEAVKEYQDKLYGE